MELRPASHTTSSLTSALHAVKSNRVTVIFYVYSFINFYCVFRFISSCNQIILFLLCILLLYFQCVFSLISVYNYVLCYFKPFFTITIIYLLSFKGRYICNNQILSIVNIIHLSNIII